MTVIGLTVAGAVMGNVFARRTCTARSPSPIRSPAVVLTEAELQRLSRAVGLVPPMEPQGGVHPPSSLTVRVSDSDVERLLEAITTQTTKHHGR